MGQGLGCKFSKPTSKKKTKNTFWIQSKHTLCDPPFFHSNHLALSYIFAENREIISCSYAPVIHLMTWDPLYPQSLILYFEEEEEEILIPVTNGYMSEQLNRMFSSVIHYL